MIHKQDWFEMADRRKPRLAQASWVPLYARQKTSEGQWPEPGHWEEYFGAVAIAFPSDCQRAVEEVGWTDASRERTRPRVEDGCYISSTSFESWRSELAGDYLVMRGLFETGDIEEVIIDADLILGLRLKREGDSWVCPYEDYVDVIRLQKDSAGRTVLIEIRAEHLKDYLCARNCGLLVSTFRSREEVSDTCPPFELPSTWTGAGTTWEGGIIEIDSRGGRYGSKVAVMTIGRTNIDHDEDVPVIGFPSDGNTWSSQAEYVRGGPKFYRARGEMWRNEWVPPGKRSPRIRGDRDKSTAEFIVDSCGSRMKAEDLVGESSRWLWFSPKVVNDLLSHRGTRLLWYTEYTGGLVLPAEGTVHFGVNSAGLINVYAKDIGELRSLWQKFWLPHNVGPDGKVARELLASQMESRPADTIAPEELLQLALERIDEQFCAEFGARLFRSHEAQATIARDVHRFVAVDKCGFFRLAKELTRLCVERMDTTLLRNLTADADKSLGTLKRLERVIDKCGVNGRDAVRELVGIYELRHSDSHLPPSDIADALELAGISSDQSWLDMGKQAIENIANALLRIADAVNP